jgi:hypothetical protein
MKIVIQCLLLLLFCLQKIETFSQNKLNKHSFELFSYNPIVLKFTSSSNYQFKIPLEENYFSKNLKYSLSSNKSIAIPDPITHIAFFCKLEDKVFDKFNFWIKFRAGDDDAYRKLIKAR